MSTAAPAGDWPEPMLPLMTPAELPAVDGYMERTGTSGFVLMERAGDAIARAAAALAPGARQVVVAAGPTNNGGDCMSAARIMRAAGRDVTLALLTAPEDLKGDPARAFATWQGPVARLSPAVIATADLIVDGIYGGGLKHDVAGDAALAVEAINTSGRPVLAVDFPTGIAGASGAILGTAVRADMTVTFFCLKPGHLLLPGRLHAGRVVVDLIGIPASVMDMVSPKTFQNCPALWAAALRSPGTDTAKGATAVVALEQGSAPPGAGLLVGGDDAFAAAFPGLVGSKVERARAAAAKGVIAILGDDAVVAAPDGRIAIAGNRRPGNAGPADSGRVADAIRTLTAAGVPGFEAAAAAAWALGEARSGESLAAVARAAA